MSADSLALFLFSLGNGLVGLGHVLFPLIGSYITPLIHAKMEVAILNTLARTDVGHTLHIDSAVIDAAQEAYVATLLEGAINAAAKAKAANAFPEGSLKRLFVSNDDIAQARLEVMAQARSADWKNLISQDSSLRPSFDNLSRSHQAFLEEVFANIKTNQDDIAAKLLSGVRPTRILSLAADNADAHNGSRHTLAVHTDAGTFLYKPRSLKADTVVKALCDELFPGQFLVPTVVDRGTFGFCQYIHGEDPQEEDAISYFTALGAFCALAYFLSMPDLHAENFLSCKGRLAPIDLETVLASSARPKHNAFAEDSFSADIARSIHQTGMLSIGNGNLFGAIMAGTRHRITPIDDCQDTLVHRQHIIKGFQDGFATCLNNKERLIKAVHLLGDATIRVLLANTRYYGALQKRYFNSANQQTGGNTAALERLLHSKKRAPLPQTVLQSEFNSIVSGDIPFFFVKANSTSLFDPQETLVEGYLADSPTNRAIQRIQALGEDDLITQTALLRKAITNMPLMGTTLPQPLTASEDALPREVALSEAAAILEQLYADITPTASSKGGLWASRYGETHKSPMNASLATGYAGAGVFAAACLTAEAGAHAHAHATAILDICLHELSGFAHKLSGNPSLAGKLEVGLSDGLGGIMKALQLIWSYTHHDAVPEIYASLLSVINSLNPSQMQGCNVYNGLGGLLLTLSHETAGLPHYQHLAQLADELLGRGALNEDGHLVWEERDGSAGELGYGKGNGGIGLAFLSAWEATGDLRYWEACCNAMDYEARNYNQELGFWPLKHVARGKNTCAPGICRGIAGQAIVFSQCAQAKVPLAQTSNQRARLCLQSIPPEPTDNLCCGTSAIVEGLLTLGLEDHAGKLLNAQVQRKNQLGFYLHENSKRVPYFNPSLFFGCLGVGYQLLRYAHPEKIGSVFL